MTVFLNREFVDEAKATISVFDRGFLFGDGLFEAFRVFNGRFFRWEKHLERLHLGLRVLNISISHSEAELKNVAEELVTRNQMPNCLLRLVISRGTGVRGYSPRGARNPTIVMSTHDVPAFKRGEPVVWSLATSSVRLPSENAFTLFKTCNKLPQILARAEADAAGADEAILLDRESNVVEGSTSNIFWIKNESVNTPPIPTGLLPGVTREAVIEICKQQGLRIVEKNGSIDDLKNSDGVFLSLSSYGIVEVGNLDGVGVARSPLVSNFHASYHGLLAAECS